METQTSHSPRKTRPVPVVLVVRDPDSSNELVVEVLPLAVDHEEVVHIIDCDLGASFGGIRSIGPHEADTIVEWTSHMSGEVEDLPADSAVRARVTELVSQACHAAGLSLPPALAASSAQP